MIEPGEPGSRLPRTHARSLAHAPEDLQPLHQLCREGRLYDVERWIAEGKPLQLAPDAIRKGTRPKSALQKALASGQHSLTFLLLHVAVRHRMLAADLLSIESRFAPHARVPERARKVLVDESRDILDGLPDAQDEWPGPIRRAARAVAALAA